MINEIKTELNKMNKTYQEALAQLTSWETKQQGNTLNFDIGQISSLKVALKDISENLTHVSLSLDDSQTDEKLTKLTHILDNLNDNLSSLSNQSSVDSLLGIIDQLSELHFIQVDQFDCIKLLIENESTSQ